MSGVDFRVVYDKSEVRVNGVKLDDRSLEVTCENVEVNVYGNIFCFGVNKRSPLRESCNRELYIERKDTSHIFLSVNKWPLATVEDGSWDYEVNGEIVHAIKRENLYKVGKLTFDSNGVRYEEPKVTFVDFASDDVIAQFPALGIGESRDIVLNGCGALNGTYDISAGQTTIKIELPGNNDWKLNVPVAREGVVFRTKDGEEIVACPFRDEGEMIERHLAIDDFRDSFCVSCCAPGYRQAEITSIKYLNGKVYDTRIPLLKDSAGFVFSNSRAYLAGRSGVDGDLRIKDLLSDQQKIDSFIIEEIPSTGYGKEVRKCRIKLYDPKSLPVGASDRSIRDGHVFISIYVSYFSHSVDKVMRWLPSDRLDSRNGVNTFDGWTSCEYIQEHDTGRWRLHLHATTMHADISSVFLRGAVMLAFIAQRKNTDADYNLLSGGFCLFDEQNNGLNIVGGDWKSCLRMAMHKRYNQNCDDLDEMLGIYTLRRYCNTNDFNSVNALRAGLRESIDNLRANIRSLGRGADLYMNALFNTRLDQWSGYAYFAGWYFADRVAETIASDEDGQLTPEECMCFYSSTGIRIWHPLMISRRSIIMAANGNTRNVWRQYYNDLFGEGDRAQRLQEVVDGVVDCLEQNEWYFGGVKHVIADLNIELNGECQTLHVAEELVKRILDWRALSDFSHSDDIECSRQDAERLFDLTQSLRNVLLTLEDLDERMRSSASSHAEGALFCDLLRMIDARNWILGSCQI